MQHNSEQALSILLDESPEPWYEYQIEKEEIMFNPMEILDKEFTVTFLKQDGTMRELTGYLVEGDKYSSDYVQEYCSGLINKTLIPVITSQGWRSFIASNVINVRIN